MSEIEVNPQFEQVLRFVNETNQPVFLTGKAGTGKTTLLKHIRQNTFKQISVVAPTGVAAINAGGSTIHSFFQFPFAPFLPTLKENGEVDASKTHLPTLKYNSQRLAIFRNLELLVIDEISMVRADLLDQIDITLRQTRKKWHLTFGGVQVLLIGDMYQLPPVVQSEEWNLLNSVYSSPFFFDSRVILQQPPVYIELEKIYRQSEATFIGLLNKVRNNQLDPESLDLLNAHYKASITAEDYRNNITLTTHNKKADDINARNLAELSGKAYTFKSKVEGNFSDRSFPADEALLLKKGTRVMFLKNNVEKNYYNGKIGVITYIDDDKIKVQCDEDRNEIEVSRETWTNISYSLNKATRHIEEEILGTFNQYPLRLAWAITIHKSQGLTFDKLIIDAAESFSAGQVYVALSRCRSLSGLTLSSRIGRQSLMNDNHILNFASTKHNNEEISSIFNSAQRNFVKLVLMNLFDFSEPFQNRMELAGIVQLHKNKINEPGIAWSITLFEKMDKLHDVGGKFRNQLQDLAEQAQQIEQNDALQERVKKAAAYFEVELKLVLGELKNYPLVTESKEAATDITGQLQAMTDALFFKYTLIKTCTQGFVFSEFIKNKLKVIYPDFKLNVYASAKNTKAASNVAHPQLYRELALLRDEIINDEQKPIYMVANAKTLTDLANYLPETPAQLMKISGFGKAKVEAYGDRFLKIIKSYMSDFDLQSNMEALKTVAKEKEKKPKKEKKASFYGSADEVPEEQEQKADTKEQTYRLFKQGIALPEIAKQRGFALSTVESHLIPYIASGDLNIDYLVSRPKQRLILDALENFDSRAGLTPVKNSLPADVSFSEIRYVMANKLKGEN